MTYASQQTIAYAKAPTRKGDQTLEADVFIPVGDGPFDLIVWMHSGGFRGGSRHHPSHRRIADRFARHGYACAFIDYRLARPPAILRPATDALLDALIKEAQASGEQMQETFYGPRALSVVEDCCAFLNHIRARCDELNLSGRYLLSGSSAGAISALNTLYLPTFLGIERPEIATVLAFSGGFSYTPRLYRTGARILAFHNASDQKVPISSIRRFAANTLDPCTLIESDHQEHGSLLLEPRDKLWRAVWRCVAFDRMTAPSSLELSEIDAAALPATGATTTQST